MTQHGINEAHWPALHNFLLAALLVPGHLGVPPAEADSARKLAIKAKVYCPVPVAVCPKATTAVCELLLDMSARGLGIKARLTVPLMFMVNALECGSLWAVPLQALKDLAELP